MSRTTAPELVGNIGAYCLEVSHAGFALKSSAFGHSKQYEDSFRDRIYILRFPSAVRARFHVVWSAQKHWIGVLGLNGPCESSDGPAHLKEALRALNGYT